MTSLMPTALLAVFLSGDAVAQLPRVDLTGRPSQVLSVPVDAVSQAVEIGEQRIVFVNRRERAIMVADFVLDSAWQVGRTGSGPGEYRNPGTPRPGPDGAIVPDLSNARALVVNADGKFSAGGYSFDTIGGFNPSVIHGVAPNGDVLLFGRHTAAGGDSLPILRVVPGTGRSTVIAWWPRPPVTFGPDRQQLGGEVGREIGSASLWPERTAWVVLPSGAVAIVRPRPYRVDIVRPDGVVIQGPPVRYTPVRVTAAEREAARQARGPMRDDVFPRELPTFQGLDDVLPAPQGHVWVERMRAWNDPDPRYDLFDERGVRIAQVVLRPRSRVVGVGRESVYVVRETEPDGEQFLERYAYSPP